MSGSRGPLSKDDDDRRRRNEPTFETTKITWDGNTRGPDLPLNLPGIRWSVRTIQWWETWRNSPQAMVMTETDWELMLETAFLVNEFWTPKKEARTGRNGKITHRAVPRPVGELKNLASEIRMRLDAVGATPQSRQRLSMKIETDNDKAIEEQRLKDEVRSGVNYFDMLNAEVAKHTQKEE